MKADKAKIERLARVLVKIGNMPAQAPFSAYEKEAVKIITYCERQFKDRVIEDIVKAIDDIK